MTKFEAPSCNTFQDIMITNFQSPNLQREIIQKNIITFFLNFHQLIYSSFSISLPSLKLLAVIVFEISSQTLVDEIKCSTGLSDHDIVNCTCLSETRTPETKAQKGTLVR